VPPILLIGHDENETFGVAAAGFAARGVDVKEHRGPAGDQLPEVDAVSGVVVFGGAMNVDMTDEYPFLLEERAFVRRSIDAGLPCLGICLGAQMLARASDRTVFPAPVREFGFNVLHLTPDGASDLLLSAFDDGGMVFHWHEDTYDLPESATILATGDEVHLQAFRIGDHAWGTQFHFEIDRAELELWLEAAGEDEVRAWGKTPSQVLDEADRFLGHQEDRALDAFARFADVVVNSASARVNLS
jgi:GMP synthase-like glutamine amidotransferase